LVNGVNKRYSINERDSFNKRYCFNQLSFNQAAASTSDTSSTSGTASESTTESSSTSESSESSTSAQTTTATNANPNPAINQICPANPGMNDRIRLIATEAHNYRRSRLAQGWVRKNTGRYLPKAANMFKLVYNCSLETSAREAADRCTTAPSTSLPSGVKENIHSVAKSMARYRVDAMKEAARYWWKQVRLVDGIGMKVIFRAKHESSPIRYFTLVSGRFEFQMAWATTKTIGCAVSENCGSTWFVACHYYEGGNMVDDAVYERGTPCSACPTGYFCNEMKLCQSAN
ncbi:SCP-like protein, partial [Ostertagia ostertagi]